MDKYYIGSNPVPAMEGYKVITPDEFLKVSNSLILMTGTENYDILKEYEEKGLIHLGLRTVRIDQFELLPYARFGGNYVIFTREWSDEKYGQFKNFHPKPELKFPKAVYVNIAKMTDEEAVSYVNKLNDLSQSLLGIDFETAGSSVPSKFDGFPEFDNFMPLGLSITDKETGYYFDFNDYFETKESRPKFYEALKQFITKNQQRLMAFNVSFEIRCLFFMYHIFFELGDTRAWCIVDERRENLKYLAQYYLGVESWDDENEAQMNGLAVLFKMMNYKEAKSMFQDYQRSKDDRVFNAFDKMNFEDGQVGIDWAKKFVKILFDLNINNPDFLPRLEKYWGNTWSCTNQQIMAKYCVIDSVMDIHIAEVIQNIEFLGKKYTKDSYMIYLYNQYLEAQIRTSGIHLDAKKRAELIDFYERLSFNTYIMVCQYYNYIIRDLSVNDKDYIPVELTDKLRYIVVNLKSTFFTNPNPVKMAKEFAMLMYDKWETNPELFETIITDHQAELSFLYDMAKKAKEERKSWKEGDPDGPEFTAWSKAFRKRERFWLPVYEILREELDLAKFYTDYNERLIAKTDRNNQALHYWSGTEEELINTLKYNTLEQSDAPKNYHDLLRRYIWDKTVSCDQEAINKTLKKYLIDSYLADFEKPEVQARTVESPVDHKLDYLITYDFNSSKVRGELIHYFQEYFEIPLWKVGAFYEYLEKKGKLDQFTKVNYQKFSKYIDDQCHGDYERIPQIRKYMYYTVDDRDEKGKVIGQHEERHIWKSSIPTAGNAGFNAKYYWDIMEKYCKVFRDDPHKYDPTFPRGKDVIAELLKFTTVINVNRAASKVLSTTLNPLIRDSYNVTHVDDMHIRWSHDKRDTDKELMYKIGVHANSVHTKRWASGFHTLPSKDDSRLCLGFRDGYIGAYFDISQAEPRSIAFLSGEPKFTSLYLSGKDAYRELAKMAFPAEANDPKKIAYRRKQCKGILLSGLYGQSIKSLSRRMGIPLADGQQIWDSFIGSMDVVKQFKEDLLQYAVENGRVKTIIGDKISIDKSRAYTSSMNYVIQGFTAVLLAAGFYNAVKEGLAHGINVSVKGVVHDSSTTEFPIRQMLHMDLHYRKYFREWCFKVWKPDFKYDLDMLLDLMHHIKYDFDMESGIVNLRMWTGYVDYFLQHFSEGYKFNIVNREDIVDDDYQGGLVKDYTNIFKTHTYMDGDYWRRVRISSLQLKLTEPLKDIDWFKVPFTEDNKWHELIMDCNKFK